MASVAPRPTSRGDVRYQVRWREDGRQQSLTYRDRKTAERIAKLIEGYGGHLPPELVETPAPAVPTVAEAAEFHVGNLTGVADRTRDDYRRMIRRHLGPLAGLPVDGVGRREVAAWTNDLTARLAPKTVANLHGLLSAIMATAVEEGWRPDNPAKGVRLPRVDSEDSEQRFLSTSEFRALVAALPEEWRVFVMLSGATGLRWSEVTALKVRDLDLDSVPALLHVRRAWKRDPEQGMVLGTPKTRKGRRRVSLPEDVAAIVAEHAAGLSRDALLFSTPSGRPIHHANFRQRVWRPACERAGLDPIPRFHDLRHSHASWLIAAGVPLPVLQARLGHESIQTTVDVYGHLMPDLQATAAAAVPSLVAGWAEGRPELSTG